MQDEHMLTLVFMQATSTQVVVWCDKVKVQCGAADPQDENTEIIGRCML